MISTGALIWTSIRPFIRALLPVAGGFALNKADLFPTAVARSAGIFVLNIATPCLLFSHIVPAFGSDSMGSLVPVAVISVIYGVTGTLMAWIIRSFFWVPHRFRYGILAAGCWGNSVDMAGTVALGLTAAAPFNGANDQNRAIAYLSVYTFVFFITLWAMGGFLLVAKDFDGPDIPSEELRERMYLRRQKMVRDTADFLRRLLRLSQHPSVNEKGDVEGRGDLEKVDSVPSNGSAGKGFYQNMTTGTTTTLASTLCPSVATSSTTELPKPPTDHDSNQHQYGRFSRLRLFLRQLLKPCTVVIALSFLIAFVDPLKALFIPPSSDFQPRFRPTAPDGQPPLACIFDTAAFVGGVSLPLSLMCLGRAFASLSFRSGESFPKGAVASLALGRMVVIPIIGVAITKAFVHVGFVNSDDKVLQFVCLLLAGLPSTSTQLFLTQLYSPTGTAEHLSAFLFPQYLIVPFTMFGVSIYTLKYII